MDGGGEVRLLAVKVEGQKSHSPPAHWPPDFKSAQTRDFEREGEVESTSLDKRAQSCTRRTHLAPFGAHPHTSRSLSRAPPTGGSRCAGRAHMRERTLSSSVLGGRALAEEKEEAEAGERERPD